MQPEMDKTRLLELIRTEYAFAERTLAQLTPEQMLVPDVQGWWSVKDTIAHLTTWMKRILVWLDKAQHGEKPDIPDTGYTWEQIDALNDACCERDRNLLLDDVLADFRKTHLQVVEAVEAMSEYELFESDHEGAFWGSPWRLITGNTFEHFNTHIVPVRQWIAGEHL